MPTKPQWRTQLLLLSGVLIAIRLVAYWMKELLSKELFTLIYIALLFGGIIYVLHKKQIRFSSLWNGISIGFRMSALVTSVIIVYEVVVNKWILGSEEPIPWIIITNVILHVYATISLCILLYFYQQLKKK